MPYHTNRVIVVPMHGWCNGVWVYGMSEFNYGPNFDDEDDRKRTRDERFNLVWDSIYNLAHEAGMSMLCCVVNTDQDWALEQLRSKFGHAITESPWVCKPREYSTRVKHITIMIDYETTDEDELKMLGDDIFDPDDWLFTHYFSNMHRYSGQQEDL